MGAVLVSAGGDSVRSGHDDETGDWDLIRIRTLAVLATVLVLAFAGGASFGQGPGAAGEVVGADANRFDFFVTNAGWITYVLIALSIVTGAMIIEHFVSIRRATIVPQDAVHRIKELIDQKKYVDAVKFTAEDPSMLGYVVGAGLVEASNGYVAMERAVEESLDERSAKLFRKIEYLNAIGNVAPMIGLFGTVYGMIELFLSIKAHQQIPPAGVVADKISIALVTTFWGLAVAIPALSAFAFLRTKVDVLTAECAITSEKLLAVFKPGATAKPKPAVSEPGERKS